MNDTTFKSNMSARERGSRIALAATLIGAVLVAPNESAVWLALIALYPMFTALMLWDPIYALFTRMTVERFNVEPQAMPIRVSQPRVYR